MKERIKVTDHISLRIEDGTVYLCAGDRITSVIEVDDVDGLQRALGRADLIAMEQKQTARQCAGRCAGRLIHRDKSESQCVLPRAHLLDDSDHQDEHGCRAPVLVSQSTIREVQAIQDARDAGLIE